MNDIWMAATQRCISNAFLKYNIIQFIYFYDWMPTHKQQIPWQQILLWFAHFFCIVHEKGKRKNYVFGTHVKMSAQRYSFFLLFYKQFFYYFFFLLFFEMKIERNFFNIWHVIFEVFSEKNQNFANSIHINQMIPETKSQTWKMFIFISYF